MADNVTIPATGTGTATPVIATDDVSSVHYQKVKLDLGGDGVSSPVTSFAPVLRISQTPTVSTSPAYTAGDAVGGLLTFANAARVSGGGGIIGSVTVVDLSQQRPSLELVLFDQTFTSSSDNAAFDPTDGDLGNVLGVVAINSWSNFNDNSVATVSGVNLPFDLTGTSLFGQLLTRSTPTFVGTSDIIVLVQVIQA